MNLYGLPGRDRATEAWMTDLLGKLALGQDGWQLQSYQHWQTGLEPDIGFEANRVAVNDTDLVIAKSLGTLVLLTAAAAEVSPASAVLIGVPLAAYDAQRRASLQAFAGARPTLFIQQTDDVTGSFAELADIVGGISTVTLEEVAGEDHAYSDTDELKSLIENWFQTVR
jgi:hypothetical protein